MFTGFSTARRSTKSTRIGPRITAIACALALTASVAGNAAAYQFPADDSNRRTPIVTPKLHQPIPAGLYLTLKIRTTSGRNALIYG